MHVRGDQIVFPTATGWQVAGVFVAYVFGSLMTISIRAKGLSQWRVSFIAFLVMLTGVSVLFREIQLGPDFFTKRFLWKTEKISWTEAEDLQRLANRSWVLSGGLKRISFNRNYADIELLILELVNRLNKKREEPTIASSTAVIQ